MFPRLQFCDCYPNIDCYSEASLKVSPYYAVTTYYYLPEINYQSPSPAQQAEVRRARSNMPSFQRQVGFAPSPVYSRQPHDDEVYVMREFAHHAHRCANCAQPYEIHLSGRTLCDRGHQLALDVAQYVYNKSGKAYSLVDREGNQHVQIEIPVGCEVVKDLLKAMERGLRLRRKAPAVSYDPTYYVAPRTAAAERPARVELVEPSRRHRRESTHISGRGSLYESDMVERAQRKRRYAQEPVYHTASPRVRAPEYYYH